MTLPQPATPNPSDAPPVPCCKEGSQTPVLDSTQLFQGNREISIRHGEETYRLRLTKSGKLILHK
ncbi:hemin uptake protein HemP [Planctomicrobium piriforme]|uniref:hemin uptake protein HemP n=1 Tax=Planctomicrobium piriforme TaxID=1576369 RepID=UPI000B86A48C